jgi:hypothetical protein
VVDVGLSNLWLRPSGATVLMADNRNLMPSQQERLRLPPQRNAGASEKASIVEQDNSDGSPGREPFGNVFPGPGRTSKKASQKT